MRRCWHRMKKGSRLLCSSLFSSSFLGGSLFSSSFLGGSLFSGRLGCGGFGFGAVLIAACEKETGANEGGSRQDVLEVSHDVFYLLSLHRLSFSESGAAKCADGKPIITDDPRLTCNYVQRCAFFFAFRRNFQERSYSSNEK